MAQKRLYGPAALGALGDLYTVPAGRKALVRHIHISNPSGAPVDVTLSVGADAVGTRIFDGFPVPADDVYDWFGFLPLAAGEKIAGSGGAALVIEISGDEDVA